MSVVRARPSLATCEMCKHFRKAEGGRGLCAALVKIVNGTDARCELNFEKKVPVYPRARAS